MKQTLLYSTRICRVTSKQTQFAYAAVLLKQPEVSKYIAVKFTHDNLNFRDAVKLLGATEMAGRDIYFFK